MKTKLKKYISIFLCLFTIQFSTFSQTKFKTQTIKGANFSYQIVENDPTNTRVYTLKNGLTVYLSVYKSAPRIQTYIAVRAGSKSDPAQATGLAHYLEHMVFKGTSKIGSLNWEQEKKYLTQIQNLFEKYRQTTDTSQRRALYKSIDTLANAASKFVAANEYDRMLSAIGASGTNAYTWVEQTVYVNEIPSNEIEKWVQIEAERFGELVPRLFHTELEAVYEEKNRSLDNDNSKVWQKMYELLFPNHPYGSQTTIGTVEHLKNPSILAIKNYFDTYYVPNNMAVCMSGDFDPDKVILLVDKYMGKLVAKPVPAFVSPVSPAITQVQKAEINGPESEKVSISFKFTGIKDPESIKLEMLSKILSNGQAGLLDLNLNQKQKVRGAYCYPIRMNDYSAFSLGASPKEGQSLDEVKSLLLGQLDSVKAGKFEDWLIQAIINQDKLETMKSLESNQARANNMVSAFINYMPWAQVWQQNEIMYSLTKKDMMNFVNKSFSDNYVCLYKKSNKDTTIKKVVKPSITPVSLNREVQSDFYKNVFSKKSDAIEPVFLNFDKAIQKQKLPNGLSFSYLKNLENKTFDLYYLFDLGTNDNPRLGLAVNYLSYLGGGGYTSEQLKKEFYKLSCDYRVSVSEDQIFINLSGLSENFVPALQLFEKFIQNPVPDQNVLDELIKDILKGMEDSKKSKGSIRSAMSYYVKYGTNSPFTNIISKEDLLKIKGNELIDLIKSSLSYPHKILYFGSDESENVLKSLVKSHTTAISPSAIPAKTFTEIEIPQTKVYWVDYDMVQAEIIFLSKSLAYSPDIVPIASLFNEYFGGSMSSIVFQEMRESKALAYSVRSNYSIASKKDKPNYMFSYIGTQADKLPEAMKGMNKLLDSIPLSEKAFDNAKEALISGLRTERIIKHDILFSKERAEKLGINYDIREKMYQQIPNFSLKDILAFQLKYVAKKPQAILVIGSKSKLNFEELKKYGDLKELKLEEIFGY